MTVLFDISLVVFVITWIVLAYMLGTSVIKTEKFTRVDFLIFVSLTLGLMVPLTLWNQ